MPDRLTYASRYKAQGLWPVPCRPDTKKLLKESDWDRLKRRQLTTQEMHEGWPTKNDNNIALVCGPAAHVLVLNVNRKNGVDGRALLQQRGHTLPPTPEIVTPSGGSAYFFEVPDVDTPFLLHNYPKHWMGIELRGADAIQVVPPSRTPEGSYRFSTGWKLEHLIVDLAHLPDWLLDLWVSLDRARVSIPANAPTDLSNIVPPSHASTDRLRSRSQNPQATPPHYTTITTELSTDRIRVFIDGFDLRERECAEAVCLRAGVPAEALDDGRTFHCRLPGHRESSASVQWGRTETGYYTYKDHHARSQETVYTVPEVYAALVSGVVGSLPKPSRMAWRLRLMVEEGWLEPELMQMKSIPDDASELLMRYIAGFHLLVACRSCHPKTIAASAPFSKAFAARWCGIPQGSVWKTQQEAIRRDLIIFAGMHKGQALFRLGKED